MLVCGKAAALQALIAAFNGSTTWGQSDDGRTAEPLKAALSGAGRDTAKGDWKDAFRNR